MKQGINHTLDNCPKKKMKKTILTILFIINHFFIHSQELKVGLIIPNEDFKSCCIYVPSSGLNIFDEPNGKPKGKIYLGEADGNNEYYKAYIEIDGVEKKLKSSNLEMIGYEVMALVFVDSKHGFLKLRNQYWVNLEELKSKKLKLTSWMDYAIKKNTEWYANQPGLNLREGPSTDFKKIITIKGNLFGITLTTEKKGKWIKVTVKEYRKHPCSGEDNLIIKTYSGWVKLISEEETLNVWNYGKGC